MAFFLYPYVRPAGTGIENSRVLCTRNPQPPSVHAKSGRMTLLTIQQWASGIMSRLLGFGSNTQTPGTEIRKARTAFHKALSDVQSPRAFSVRYQIEVSRTLKELWHLRAEVFGIIADSRGESEAKERICLLDRNFPSSPRRSTRDTRSSKVSDW